MHPGDRKLYGDQAPSPKARRPQPQSMLITVFSRPPQYVIARSFWAGKRAHGGRRVVQSRRMDRGRRRDAVWSSPWARPGHVGVLRVVRDSRFVLSEEMIAGSSAVSDR